ncbi:helix-turn-helix transcriptional regulator [Pectobacterium aroidearum]|jgi:prophage regulatory protein|uniref:helix-turn-helix transcriptional regulator n=1 Tax=Pectobacterium aroidearum TaxID=1201031 RepID=UPI0015F0B093|nr:AlpA family phage regulatory protein [Pectobacterium aroidearum]MBA5235475.1 AlpA family phage regulatory protein [Pectobacterium aroidearum]
MKNVQLIPLKMVLEIYPVSRATLYRQIKAGFFPEPVQIGARRVAWRMDEIQERIDNLQKVALSDRH